MYVIFVFFYAFWLVRAGPAGRPDVGTVRYGRGKGRGNRDSSDASDQEEDDDDKYTKNVREMGGEGREG